MAIFNSYVKLPEGIEIMFVLGCGEMLHFDPAEMG